MVKFVVGLAVGLTVGVAVTLTTVVTLGRASASEAKGSAAKPVAREQPQQIAAQARDNRLNSIASTLQTMRGQIELFKIQHADNPPAADALAVVLTGRTNPRDISQTVATGTLGPYVQSFPANPLNGKSAVGAAPLPNVGWVYHVDGGQYTIEVVNTAGNGVLTY